LKSLVHASGGNIYLNSGRRRGSITNKEKNTLSVQKLTNGDMIWVRRVEYAPQFFLI